MKVSYQRENVTYIPGKVEKDAETTKRRIYSRYFDLQNLPQNTTFVAFGIDTMGALGPEAVTFMKEICNYFPNGITAQLKHRMKMLISTYIRRGKRFVKRPGCLSILNLRLRVTRQAYSYYYYYYPIND